MDDLLKEIDLTPGEKSFYDDISGKGADHDALLNLTLIQPKYTWIYQNNPYIIYRVSIWKSIL